MVKIFKVKYIFYLWKQNVKCIRLFSLLFVFYFLNIVFLSPIKDVASQYHSFVTPWVFPYLLSDVYYSLLFLFGAIYFYSNVPCMHISGMYQLIRLGRERWMVSHIVTIFLKAFTYIIFQYLVSVAALFPYIWIEKDWGQVLRTIALTDVLQNSGGLFSISYDVMNTHTPIELLIKSFVIGGLVVAFVGLFMFTVSIYFSRVVSIICVTSMTLFSIITENTQYLTKQFLSKITPTYWIKITKIGSIDHGAYLPNQSYIITVLLFAIVILSMLCIFKITTLEFSWSQEE